MAEFKVTYKDLETTAEKITTQSKAFRTIMGEIETTMADVKKKWESDAADSFQSQFTKLVSNFNTYEKTIDKYAAYLLKTAEEFKKVDANTQTETAKLDGASLFV